MPVDWPSTNSSVLANCTRTQQQQQQQ
jgi:hypothetical protein